MAATPPPLLRLLLRLYPRAYRARWAEEMEACYRQDRARSGGGVRFHVGAVVDHVRAAHAVRRRGRTHRDRSQPHPTREDRMKTLLDDVGHAARALRRAPAFTAFAVLTLALGIGATTAAFTVLDRVVLRPLPYPGAERMVVVGATFTLRPDEVGGASANFLDALVASPGPAEAVVGVGEGSAVLRGAGELETIGLARVTDGFFAFFGARAAAGRLFTSADQRPGGERIAVLGHALWTTRFGSDPEVVGSIVLLDDVPHTVVGVLNRDFAPPERLVSAETRAWVPLRSAGLSEGERFLHFFIRSAARLRPGVEPSAFEARADGILRATYGERLPSYIGGAAARDLQEATVGGVGSALGRAVAAVALLLIIACVNTAGLLLTRGSERARELAVRSALGAGPVRLLRQLACESFLLAIAAAVAGGTVAFLAVDAFRRHAPADLPRLSELTVDGRGFAFAAAAGLVTALLSGIPVAVIAIRRAGPGVGRTTTPADGPARSVLVVAETTLAVMLVVGAGLLARDLVRLSTEDPGFDPDGVIAVSVDLRSRSMEPEERRRFWRALSDQAAAFPGVTAVALASSLPYGGTGVMRLGYLPEGWERAEDFPLIASTSIGGDYPTTMGVAVVEGRMLTADDAASGGIMVNEAFVRAFWPGEAAVGRTVDADRSEEVIGVLADTRRLPGIPVEPIVYQHAESGPSLVLLVRAGGAEAALVPALRDLVQRLDANLPVGEVSTLESLAWRSLARPRFYAGLFSSIGLTALLLALVGIYGTTAYATRSRTREIGIRMALGAGTGRIVSEVALRTALALSAGIVAGLVAVALAARGLDDFLVTLEPRDVSTYGLVAALVLASGLAAALLPARRASRVDPASTLREEK